ncbi:MAG: OmpA family protein [Erythrobacter sp.]
MPTLPKTTLMFSSLGVIAVALPAAVVAQQPVPVPASSGPAEVLTTVYGSTPTDLSELNEGPKVEGLISARNGDQIQVTSPDGTNTLITVGDVTRIRASGGFLGLGKTKLTQASLLNGLPVEVNTVQWGRALVAEDIKLKGKDLKTANMIRNGTEQRFGEQGARITKNTAATEALRGRFGDIDKYNIKRTTNVYFDTNKFNLSAESRQELCATAAEADATENSLMLVLGYTDSTGSYEVNQALSEKRAARVVNYLQQQCGWKPYRMLTPAGMAESDPAADNTSAYGKAQNRRVAVNILVSKSVDGL